MRRVEARSLSVLVLVLLGLSLAALVQRGHDPATGPAQLTIDPSPTPDGSRSAHPTVPAPREWLRDHRGPPDEERAGTGSEDEDPAPRRASSATPATPAPPTEGSTGARSGETIEDRGEAALARISYPWEGLGFTIRFDPPREGLRGVTYASEREIRIYVRLTDPLARTAHDLAHEIGHAADIVHMDRERRNAWLDARGAAGTEWWSCDYCEDRGHGSGDYAEVFALWQTGPSHYSSQLAARPSDRELDRLATFFRSGDGWRRHYGTPDEDEEDEEEERGLVPCVVGCG